MHDPSGTLPAQFAAHGTNGVGEVDGVGAGNGVGVGVPTGLGDGDGVGDGVTTGGIGVGEGDGLGDGLGEGEGVGQAATAMFEVMVIAEEPHTDVYVPGSSKVIVFGTALPSQGHT